MDHLREDVAPSDVEALRRELAAARREQAASAEVLRIVSRCGANASPVFDAILEACVRLYSPYGAAIYLVQGEMAKGVARRGFSDGDWGTDATPLAGSHTGQALAERRPVHIEDLADVARLPDDKRAMVRGYGGLTTLYVPMIAGERGVGSLVVARRPKRPFSEAEIASLSTFADQAVIAIENARLFEETQEAAAQQSATADVLKAINRSAFDPQAVLEALVDSAVMLTGSTNGLIWRCEDGLMHVRAAAQGERRDDFVAHMRAHPQSPGRGSVVARVAETGEVQNIADMHADLEFTAELRAKVQTRAALGVPMKRGDELVGAVVLSKPEAGVYPERIVELVKTFADQAVIAIRNAGLFEEAQARKREAEEALERQTATSKILEVIASSPTDAGPVFEAIAQSANAVVKGRSAGVYRFIDGRAHLMAVTALSREADAALRSTFPLALADFPPFAAVSRGGVSEIPDTDLSDNPQIRELARLRGYRSMVFVPLVRQGAPIGLITCTRPQPGAFSPHDIALLRAFADQAVIAIENARLFEEVQAKTRDLEESLAQQTATADVLKVISRSAFDLGAVFDTLITSAVKLVGMDAGLLCLRKGEEYLFRAGFGLDPRLVEFLKSRAVIPSRASTTARILLTRAVVRIEDTLKDPDYVQPANPIGPVHRAHLGVPLLRGDQLEGSLALVASEPRSFNQREVELLQTFADQAVIAIENSRLIDEVRARTRELEEALTRQTATADVLKVISRSPGDLKPVLDAIAETAARLCGSDMTMFFRFDGEVFRILASWNFPPEVQAMLEASAPAPGHPSALGRAGASLKPVYIPDVTADPAYGLKTEQARAHYRATLAVPMLREGRLVGALSLNRSEPNSFTSNHIALVSTFADQAAIAFENVRLFEQVQARTHDLEEALAQQTATADVLKVISRSAFGLKSVLQTLVDSAVRLCAQDGVIYLRDGDVFRAEAAFGAEVPGSDPRQRSPRRPGRDSVTGRVALSGRVEQIPDNEADPDFKVAPAQRMKMRALLGVPLLSDGRVDGVFVLAKPEAGPFSDRAVEVVRTFADQAVIAIQNVRLFEQVQARTHDLEEALAQQTATADVLKAISRSVFDLDSVLQTLIDTAVRLAHGSRGTIFMRDGDLLRARAFHSQVPASLKDYLIANPIPFDSDEPISQAMREGRLVHVPDMSVYDTERVRQTRSRAGFGSALWAPLMRNGEAIGLFGVPRERAAPFSEREIELVRTFADQAVIAIENARLFGEVQARTRDLEHALERQTATSEILRAIAASPGDADRALQFIAETCARLFSAPSVSIQIAEGEDFVREFRVGAIAQRVGAANPRSAIKVGGRNLPGTVVAEARQIHIPDLEHLDPAMADFPGLPHARAGGARTVCGTPLRRDDRAMGALIVFRNELRPFSGDELSLLQTFADQAVIAIENARLFAEVQARTRELEESLGQQTATANVLKVISRAAFDLQAVFDALLASAVDLVGGVGGAITLREGDSLRFQASAGPGGARMPDLIGRIMPIDRSSAGGRAAGSGRIEYIRDADADAEFHRVASGAFGHSYLGVPLMRDGRVEGALTIISPNRDGFTQRHIDLVQTFADQAVIAIENSRLFEQVQARTRELEESLAQQTATADVLKVISRSAFDLQKVLDTLIASAVPLTGADNGAIYLRRDDAFHVQAHHNPQAEPDFFAKLQANPQRPGRGSVGARVLLTGEIVHMPDNRLDADYDPTLRALTVSRAVLGVPLKRDGAVVGAIVLARYQPGLFAERQIELARTFADQAVIAIENSRLLNEVQARTRELEQSLADLRKAQDRLVQSEKLASLGQLTAGIAHEIKNPLNFVNNFAGLSRELMAEMREALEKGDAEEVEELAGLIDSNLEKVAHHGRRADSIVKNMLLHSREGSGERALVDVNAMVEEALNLAYHGARAEKPGFNVTLEKALDPATGAAELYLQEITRVLINLIGNGFYATAKRREGGGSDYQPTLKASTRDLGHNVEIRIRDNGTGIPDEVRAKMFNPFFTTKPAGEGTGLGLSLSHDIVVKQHGGMLDVETEPGAFTEFVITLPRKGAGA